MDLHFSSDLCICKDLKTNFVKPAVKACLTNSKKI